jgi:hypothetical protein
LAVYRRDKGVVSGLGEAVLERAFADAGSCRNTSINSPQATRGARRRPGLKTPCGERLYIKWAVTMDRAAAAAVALARTALDSSAASPRTGLTRAGF